MKNSRSKILKLIILIAVILLLVILSIELLPLFQNLTTPEGREKIEYTLEDMGWQGVFALIGLMIAQVLVPFLPGEPVELIAGVCYGPVWGTVLIIIRCFFKYLTYILFCKKIWQRFYLYIC